MEAATRSGRVIGGADALRVDPRPMGDDDLVLRVRAGDAKAFERIFDRYRDPILSFCRHMLGSREDAEDATQHAFMAAHRGLRGSDRPVDLRPWLFAIARNRCLDLLRARRAADPLDDERVVPASVDGLLETVQRRADLRALVSDIQSLPEAQRAALVMFELGGMSQAQLAEVLGCRSTQVKALIYQARASLMADREARRLECRVVRQELSTARAHDLLRGHLRRHLRVCVDCRAFAGDVRHQREALALVLPALPTAGLKGAVLAGALGGGTAATGAGVAGVASTTAGSGAATTTAPAVAGAAGAGTAGLVATSTGGGVASGIGGLMSKGLVVKALAVAGLFGAVGGGVTLVRHAKAPGVTARLVHRSGGPAAVVLAAPVSTKPTPSTTSPRRSGAASGGGGVNRPGASNGSAPSAATVAAPGQPGATGSGGRTDGSAGQGTNSQPSGGSGPPAASTPARQPSSSTEHRGQGSHGSSGGSPGIVDVPSLLPATSPTTAESHGPLPSLPAVPVVGKLPVVSSLPLPSVSIGGPASGSGSRAPGISVPGVVTVTVGGSGSSGSSAAGSTAGSPVGGMHVGPLSLP